MTRIPTHPAMMGRPCGVQDGARMSRPFFGPNFPSSVPIRVVFGGAPGDTP